MGIGQQLRRVGFLSTTAHQLGSAASTRAASARFGRLTKTGVLPSPEREMMSSGESHSASAK